MKLLSILPVILLLLLAPGCAPLDEIYSHDLNTGILNMKKPGAPVEKIFLQKKEDSLIVFPLDRSSPGFPNKISVALEHPAGSFVNTTFTKTSADFDLSTVVLKYRPARGGVPNQLNANVNGLLYTGFRKDYYRLLSRSTGYGDEESFVSHTGFDFGVFAGIGITPLNATVTDNAGAQEYDGIVLQKGFAVFGTYGRMSVGLSIGFDNLLDKNRSIWIYNNKPWFGLILGIANF